MTAQVIPLEKRCKATVYPREGKRFGGYSCSRKATRDGWCETHHPEKIAARDKKAKERLDKKMGSFMEEKNLQAKTLHFYSLKEQVVDLINEIKKSNDQDLPRIKSMAYELKIKVEIAK